MGKRHTGQSSLLGGGFLNNISSDGMSVSDTQPHILSQQRNYCMLNGGMDGEQIGTLE